MTKIPNMTNNEIRKQSVLILKLEGPLPSSEVAERAGVPHKRLVDAWLEEEGFFLTKLYFEAGWGVKG